MSSKIVVPFHGTELFVVEHNGQPYTPMKPIAEGMGLTWQSQHEKLKQRFSSTITEIVMVANDGKERLMTCLPIRKLAAWLYSISPNKIPNLDTRAKVIMYQSECDDVLWDYWTKGQAINARHVISPEQQSALQEVVRQRAQGCRKAYAEMWARHNRHFKIGKYDQLLAVHFDDAKAYLADMQIKAKPEPAPQNPAPMVHDVYALCNNMLWVYSWWQRYGSAISGLNPNIAAAVHDRFVFGGTEANMLLRQIGRSGNAAMIYAYPWHESVETRNRYWLVNSK
jgi:hypothetical protein